MIAGLLWAVVLIRESCGPRRICKLRLQKKPGTGESREASVSPREGVWDLGGVFVYNNAEMRGSSWCRWKS